MITPEVEAAKDVVLTIMGRKYDNWEGLQENLFKQGLKVWGDTNGWGSEDPNHEAIFIAWEEGPYEWPIEIAGSEEVQATLVSMGYYVDIVCMWGLIGIYPI